MVAAKRPNQQGFPRSSGGFASLMKRASKAREVREYGGGIQRRECSQSGLAFSRSISSANAVQLSAMIVCSSDRWIEIPLDDASTLHSTAYILHCIELIIVISQIGVRERNTLGRQLTATV
jgi:hypothetical protein